MNNGWISVKDDLPDKHQPVQFINNTSDTQAGLITKMLYPETPLATVRFGYVNEINRADPDNEDVGRHENWIEIRVSPMWWTVTGINGHADHVTHWQPLAKLPGDKDEQI